MKTKHILISSLLAIALSTPAIAEKPAEAEKSKMSELADPIIALMPAFKKVREELKLNAEQSKTIDDWLAAAPQKKKELKENILTARAILRESLINRGSRMKREELKFNLGEANRRLIELQSLCARMLHNTLSDDQYAKVVAQYKQLGKS